MFSIDLGAHVAIIDVDKEKADTAAVSICEKGGVAKAWQCDISDPKAMENCGEEIRNHFGKVDIVVCNAAILFFAHTLELTNEQVKKAYDVNVLGTLYTIRAFLRGMEERNSGQIVTVSSIAGHFGETYGMAYCPTKFAVRGIMECLQMEMRDRGFDGIKCTTLCPYFVRTPMILGKGMRPTSRLVPFMSINRCAREAVDAILKEKIVAFIPGWIQVMPMLKVFMSKHIAKAGRDYLDCRYEPVEHGVAAPAESSKTTAATNDSLRTEATAQELCLSNGKVHQDALITNTTGEKKEPGRHTRVRPSVNSESSAGSSSSSAKSCEKPLMPSSSKPINYFKFASPLWYFIIPPALAFTFITWYQPEWIPVRALSYLGQFAYNLGTQHNDVVLWINVFALVAHIGEAVYALFLCDSLNLSHSSSFKWFLQTFILGFPSLILLRSYRRKSQK
ncbi:oxidoreductaseshort chain dehydrogenase/reductase family protein [Aphelenchoides avenae]|nr:oxidoreductaseshort chain dehydrogenase/reductase family protein [Aphelenchus avenae]